MARNRRLASAALALICLLALALGGATQGALARGHGRARHGHAAKCAKAGRRGRHSRRHRAARARRCAKTRHRRAAKRRHRRHGGKPGDHGLRTRTKTAQSTQAPAASSDAGACEGAHSTPSEQNLALVTAATLCLIDRERGAHGEQPLRANADLAHAAKGHSESMSAGAYFEHVSPDGATPLARVKASGYFSSEDAGFEVGENIAWGSLADATPAAIVSAWMASPPHRANILNGDFRDTGIGISPRLPAAFAGGQAGAIYTQDFGAIL